MTSPEYQAPTWVNEDDPDFVEGVSPDLGAGYLNQLSGAVEDHGQRLGAITPVVTYLNANAISQDAGDNRWILQDNANGFAPAEATANALAGKQPLDADLTALAGLDSATAGTVASDGAGWVKKTYAQLKTALGLATIATSGKLADATDLTTTGAAAGQVLTVGGVTGGVPSFELTETAEATAADLGLGNVNNTSDANKPISTATQAALDTKAPLAAARMFTKRTDGYLLGTGATASQTFPNGALCVAPLMLVESVTVTAIGGDFVTAGEAGSLQRLLVFADDGHGYPGALAVDGGSISTGTGNAGTVATGGTPGVYMSTLGSPVVLAAGLYWVGQVSQGAAVTAPTVRTGVFLPSFVFSSPTVPTVNQTVAGYRQNSVTGTPPSTFSATVVTVNAVPRTILRIQ